MKIRIGDREYDAVNYKTASLLHLMELRQQSRAFTEDGKGLGMHAMERMQRRSAEYQRQRDEAVAGGRDVAGIDAPDDADLWLGVVVFLSRRAAGEKITFLEAIDVPLGGIEAIREPGDELDPTVPEGGSPATTVGPATG